MDDKLKKTTPGDQQSYVIRPIISDSPKAKATLNEKVKAVIYTCLCWVGPAQYWSEVIQGKHLHRREV